jgi:simple sugar transport system permease protein
MDISTLNDIVAASVRISTPIALAALGGVFCQKAAVFNIGLEGMMLVGSFFAVCGVIISGGSIWIGLLFATLFGLLFSLLFALAVLKFKANQIITGIGLNLLGVGLTSFILRTAFHTSGVLRPPVVNKIPLIQLDFLKNIPIIGGIFGEQHVITYISFAVVIITAILLYRTSFGISSQAIGELPEAVATAGVKPEKICLWAILWSGALCGQAGSYLSIVAVNEFTENMVQGRGFTAFTSLIFGNANPYITWLVSVLFGFADALGIRIQITGLGFPSSILKMFPYALSVLILGVSCYMREMRIRRNKTL